MKVVCDTNILFAAIINPMGAPRQVLDAWQRRRFTLLTSKQQLSEIRRVSRYPTIERHTTRAARGALIRRIELTGIILDVKTIPGLCDDPVVLLQSLTVKAWFHHRTTNIFGIEYRPLMIEDVYRVFEKSPRMRGYE